MEKLFRQSMILSDDAKKFALALELARVQVRPQYSLAILNSCWILLTYNVAKLINKKLDMFNKKKPPIMRGMLYLGIAPMTVCSFFLWKDFILRFTERKAVREAASLGPQYSRGGEEYYSKLLLRNKCLKVLEPEQSKFTLDGELYQGVLRTKRVPLMELRALCTEAKEV